MWTPARVTAVLCALPTGLLPWFAPQSTLKVLPQSTPALRVSSSDRALEQQIGEYLQQRKGWRIQFEMLPSNPDDLLLFASFECGEGIPDIRLMVDALPSARNKTTNEVTETRLRVSAVYRYGVHPGHAQRTAVLEALNELHSRFWAPERSYLDRDGDLVLESSVNIPGQEFTVHPELVSDAMERLILGWKDLYRLLGDRSLPLPTRF
jgi:hypothetical protein